MNLKSDETSFLDIWSA